ncbi:DUF6447 family protein [Desulfobotulus mexicanus]|uniref:Uncharacterized protein n=1 Tax=Desulfobotulus mexicanus TaxID=2586642 RepID=A0A5S5MBR4_9BACT|nr:DUF6447 family protein [Desulfobotulus mexicanus]TYT73158.1 hypothetical protein FIM25_16615 [Desulfobotulus mexicanus]TYT73176.1 hypothetical protein FIM25_16445 [Desulfobotulus mexicanus]
MTIDERRYLLEDFSEEGRQQLLNLRTADAELKRLKDQEAIAHTARESYGRALAEAIKSARPVTVQ